MNILLCLGTQKGFFVLKELVKNNIDLNISIIIRKEKNVFENFYDEILDIAEKNNINIFKWGFFIKNFKDIIKLNNIKSLICVGWPYLIPSEIIKMMKGEVVIAHDSLLPKYRGFSPLPSAIINGDKITGLTVLYATDKADSGNIIYQDKIIIETYDTIKNVLNKICPLYFIGICEYIKQLKTGTVKSFPQNHEKATFSVWRDKEDYFINWDETSEKIERMVRALGPPYLMAQSYLDKDLIYIEKVEIIDDINFEIRYPGKVWEIKNGCPDVICGKGMIKIISAYNSKNSIIPFKKLKSRFK